MPEQEFLILGRKGALYAPGCRKTRFAFTLVELLVVVAIIALLVSILLPSLTRAKEQTRIVVCMTNYKGLGTATELYTSEANDHYPAGAGWGGDPPTWEHRMYLHQYYEDFQLLHCPSDRLDRVPFYGYRGTPINFQHPRSYAINVMVSYRGCSEYGRDYNPPYLDDHRFPWPGTARKTMEIKIPSGTIYLGEMWESWYYGSVPQPGIYNDYKGHGITVTNSSYTWEDRGPDSNVHRDNDAANYLFCDGRVVLLNDNDPKLRRESNFYYWRAVK